MAHTIPAYFLRVFKNSKREITDPEEKEKLLIEFSMDGAQDDLFTYMENRFFLFYDKKRKIYWTVLSNQDPVSVYIEEVEKELADFAYSEGYFDDLTISEKLQGLVDEDLIDGLELAALEIFYNLNQQGFHTDEIEIFIKAKIGEWATTSLAKFKSSQERKVF